MWVLRECILVKISHRNIKGGFIKSSNYGRWISLRSRTKNLAASCPWHDGEGSENVSDKSNVHLSFSWSNNGTLSKEHTGNTTSTRAKMIPYLRMEALKKLYPVGRHIPIQPMPYMGVLPRVARIHPQNCVFLYQITSYRSVHHAEQIKWSMPQKEWWPPWRKMRC